MNIPLDQFLDIVTYNKLFDYVTMPSHIGAQCVIDDPEHNICFVEPVNEETCTIWYPITSWINELKRREEFEQKLVALREANAAKPLLHPKQFDVQEISQQLIQAHRDDDREAIARLTKQLESMI